MSEQDILKFEQMLEEDSQSRAFAPLAEAHRKAGNLEEAIRVAEAGLEIHPGYTGGLVVLGRAYYEKKELDKAAEVLKKAVDETPESYLGQKFLGKVLVDKGEIQDALRALEAANLLSPDDEEVARLLEEIRPKAAPPKAIVFSHKHGEDDSGEAQIVTYEQKPVTVDGVELTPLPVKVEEEAFSFSEIKEEKEIAAPVPVGTAEETAKVKVVSLDELGPEAAAFIEEADEIEDASFSVPAEETVQGEGEEEEEDPFTIEELIEEISTEPEPELSPPPLSEPADQIPVEKPEDPITPQAAHGPEEIISPPLEDLVDEVPVVQPMDPAAPQAVDGPEEITPSPLEEPPCETPVEHPTVPPPPQESPRSVENVPSTSGERLVQQPVPDQEWVSMESPVGSLPPEQTLPKDVITGPYTESSLDHSGTAGAISTETLADLYAKQGLVEKAVEIYRQILQERPDDQGVVVKLRVLEENAETEPQADAFVATESPAPDMPSVDSGDPFAILESWLQNAERMKRK